ncbi:hypothetical protein [Sphingobium aromaticiconvertens]|uniref:hypothetical protein n=1 Tax=Sphingobium aromaticiconvertens TaxID=365341 RepID=UPI0030194449
MSVWIAETLLATSLLMALVMLLRRPTARFLGAGAAYMLWALPLARLVLPPSRALSLRQPHCKARLTKAVSLLPLRCPQSQRPAMPCPCPGSR